MPNKKISQLPESLVLSTPDYLPIVANGVTLKITGQTLLDFTNQFVAGLSANWNRSYSTTSLLSSFWNSVFTTVGLGSADWDSVYSSSNQVSAFWNSVYTYVNFNSAGWEAVESLVNDVSGNWNTVYSNVHSNSANWNVAYNNVNKNNSVYSNVNSNSASWEAAHNLVDSTYRSWNSVYSNVNSNSASWEGAHNLVNNLSGNWNTVYSNVNSNSASWNDTKSTVDFGSPLWNNAYNNSIIIPSLSANWNSGYTNSISNGAKLTLVGNTSGTWDSVYSNVVANSASWNVGGQAGGGTTISEITANIAAGGIAIGTKIPAGTTIQQFVESLLVTTYYPFLNGPTVSVTSSIGTTVESGTTGITITVNTDRGSIIGNNVNSIWNPNSFQNYRAGAITGYVIGGQLYPNNNSLLLSDVVIEDGTNEFTASAGFADGPQPRDSKGNNFSTPLAAATYVSSLYVNGVRKYFYGLDNSANSSASIRSLTNSALSPTNGTSFSITIPVGTTSVVFAYPASLRNVSSVKESVLNAEIKSAFAQTTVDVEGASEYTAISYKVYRYQPAEPFANSVTYTVII